MTTISTRFDDKIELLGDEAEILLRTQDLLRSKPSEFRQAFIAELTNEFCIQCGNYEPCWCGRDD